METLRSIPGISPEEPERTLRETIDDLDPRNWDHERRLKAGKFVTLGGAALMAAVINHQPVTQMAVDALLGHDGISATDTTHPNGREYDHSLEEADFSDLVRDFNEATPAPVSDLGNEVPIQSATDILPAKHPDSTTYTMRF